jgi:hypothetical protein
MPPLRQAAIPLAASIAQWKKCVVEKKLIFFLEFHKKIVLLPQK